jgi:uncharacterized protein YndB with AHSA1/START domain
MTKMMKERRLTPEDPHEEYINQLPTGRDTLAVTTFYPGVTPQELFSYWVEPPLLKQWWPQQAEVDAAEGGEYHLSWPAMSWDLRGQYTAFRRGERLGFTWKWDHEPDLPTRQVDVAFEPVGDLGTQLTVTHGTYDSSKRDQDDRDSHMEGWTYFLTRLHSAASA